MTNKNRLKTPKWILEGYDSPEEYEKSKGDTNEKKKDGKSFNIRKCPKCGSDDVGVVVGEEAKDLWKCEKCGWKGREIKKEELSEEEFMKYLDKKGEEVS